MRDSARRETASRRRPLAALLLLALLLPGSALATGIADITPLYFDGPDGQGFSAAELAAAGRVPSYSATAQDDWIDAGATALGLPIQIDQALGTVHQNPPSPTAAAPVIADSLWTVHNETGSLLVAPLLVFTRVDPSQLYPIALPPTGLDGDLLALLSYSYAGGELFYGAIQLPTLPDGASAEVTVRYVVAGALAPGNPMPLPPLGVAVLGSYALVPEPSSAALLCVGLLLAAARARAKRA